MYPLLEPSIGQLVPHINWSCYFAAWGVPGRYPEVFTHPEKGRQALALYQEAQRMLLRMQGRVRPLGVMATLPARAVAGGIDIDTDGGTVHIPTPQVGGSSVSAFVEPSGGEVTLFTFSAGTGVGEMCDEYRRAGDDYSAFCVKLLADRLAEAFAEMALLGGCRIAVGYTSLPDHAVKRTIVDALDPTGRMGLEFTCTDMIVPAETVCGIWLRRGHYLYE